jgi:hypothetical protein
MGVLSQLSVLTLQCLAGVSAVAADDGVGAAAVAARTLRVAAQYIQYRKDREAPQRVHSERLSPGIHGESRLQQQGQEQQQSGDTIVLRNIVPVPANNGAHKAHA